MPEVLEFFDYPYKEYFPDKELLCCTEKTFRKLTKALYGLVEDGEISQTVARSIKARSYDVYVMDKDCVAIDKAMFEMLFSERSKLALIVQAKVVELTQDVFADCP